MKTCASLCPCVICGACLCPRGPLKVTIPCRGGCWVAATRDQAGPSVSDDRIHVSVEAGLRLG